MLNLFGFESPLALDGVAGELGELVEYASNCCGAASGDDMSMSEGARLLSLSEFCTSLEGERGAPSCDTNESTRIPSVCLGCK